MPKARVKFFNKDRGYGFLEIENEVDLFFHFSEILNSDSLQSGDPVSFEFGESKRGEIATKIKLLEE